MKFLVDWRSYYISACTLDGLPFENNWNCLVYIICAIWNGPKATPLIQISPDPVVIVYFLGCRFPVPLSPNVVRSRLTNNYYRNVEAVKHDINVMVSNALSYFSKNTEHFRKMKKMAESFERTLSKLWTTVFPIFRLRFHHHTPFLSVSPDFFA